MAGPATGIPPNVWVGPRPVLATATRGASLVAVRPSRPKTAKAEAARTGHHWRPHRRRLHGGALGRGPLCFRPTAWRLQRRPGYQRSQDPCLRGRLRRHQVHPLVRQQRRPAGHHRRRTLSEHHGRVLQRRHHRCRYVSKRPVIALPRRADSYRWCAAARSPRIRGNEVPGIVSVTATPPSCREQVGTSPGVSSGAYRRRSSRQLTTP